MNIPDFKVLLKIFGNKANGPAVLDANGDLVGNIIPRTGLLADLQALAGTPGEIAYATDFPAIVTFNGVAGQAKTTFPTASGLRAAVIPTIPGFIGSNTTVTIGTGKNFADVAAFKTFIEQCVVDESATITMVFDAGSRDWTAPTAGRTWPHIALCSDQTSASAEITGVSISATGSAGAYTLTLTKTGLGDAVTAGAPLVITDGTAGTNPDNAVGWYSSLTRVDANTITVASASGLAAMPSGAATCTVYSPKAFLTSLSAGGAAGNIRSISLGNGTYAPVSIATLTTANQTIKAASTNALVVPEVQPLSNTYFVDRIYTQSFVPVGANFKGSVILITDTFGPQDCSDLLLSNPSFIIDQGLGSTSFGCPNTYVGFGGVIILNTLSDGQLEPVNGGVMEVGTLTINGTAVTAANLANYTTLTPGFLSDSGGLIYFAGNNKLTNPYSNATASRALNTNYTNSGKRSLLVTVSARCVVTVAGGSATIQGFSDTAATPTTEAGPLVGVQSGLLNEDNTFSTTFVVAPGTNYRVNSAVSNGTATLGTWWELTL